MYSCANYPRGCRGRTNREGAKCNDCRSLNLRRPGTASPFAQPRNFSRQLPSERLSSSILNVPEKAL